MVRARARHSLPAAGVLDRRCDCGLRVPAVGDAIPGSEGAQGAQLRRRFGFGNDPRGVLLHGAATLRGYLPDGCGTRSGGGVSVFRPRDQRPRDHPHREGAGCSTWRRARRRGDPLLGRHRRGHAPPLPSRGAGQGREDGRTAGSRGSPSALADGALLCGNGGGARLCQLGTNGRRDRLLRNGLCSQVVAYLDVRSRSA